eukprot:TRINITY_DN2384_c0_g2_i1.p1 TRINITY_DN2384_c0_g2~~TRINITY_DN2384_c0_g2_i1.p1  ORF type:complete len:361 (-),score=33.26 TRINITY_DN2384_c0_g2_i1:336-1418(-)
METVALQCFAQHGFRVHDVAKHTHFTLSTSSLKECNSSLLRTCSAKSTSWCSEGATSCRIRQSVGRPSSLVGATLRSSLSEPLCNSLRCKQGKNINLQRQTGLVVSAQQSEGQSEPSDDKDSEVSWESLLGSAGIWLLWAAFVGYAFFLAPNQTEYRDTYFVEKLLSLHADDGFVMNPILVSVWNLMGIWPAVYASLLIPSGRSSTGSPPVWPFSTASTFVGAFALLPYFASWRGEKGPKLPSREERANSWPIRVFESKITAVSLLVGSIALLVFAGAAGGGAWVEYEQYFRESRLVHVTSLDFLILWSLAPFWLYNDMSVRKWDGRDKWWVPLSLLPIIGPAAYLLVRPPIPEAPEERP